MLVRISVFRFPSTFDIRHLLVIFSVTMNLLINLFLGIFVLVALLMVLVILMQRPKSEGLGAAFGGAVTENIFGAQTTNVLVKFTAWLAGIFFALSLALLAVSGCDRASYRNAESGTIATQSTDSAPLTQAEREKITEKQELP